VAVLVSVRILIEGKKVQKMGYRIFLLEKALENGIENVYARNIDRDKVEILLSDEKDKIEKFYEVIRSEKPSGALVKHIRKQPYDGKTPIPPINRYFQFLTLEQLSMGREEVLKLPRFVGSALETVASALKGIDEKFGDVAQRFGVFGEYAQKMDAKLTGIDEKLDKIATLPEKIDKLPEKIAKAIQSEHEKA
jgi:acylphosphatase